MDIKELITEYRDMDCSDEDIIGSTYSLYVYGKISKEELEAVWNELGYEFDEEFAKLDDFEARKFALDNASKEAFDKHFVDNPTDGEEPRKTHEEE